MQAPPSGGSERAPQVVVSGCGPGAPRESHLSERLSKELEPIGRYS